MAEKHLKMYILSYQIRINQHDSDFIFTLIKMTEKKSQVTVHPGKDVEQRKHSSSAGVRANLYSLFGNQFGSITENCK